MDKDGGQSEGGEFIYKTVLYCNNGKEEDQ
jgi:hypothetical protein